MRPVGEASLFWSLAFLLAALALLPAGRLILAGGDVEVLLRPAVGVALLHTLVVSLGGMAVSGLVGGGAALLMAAPDLGRRPTLLFLFSLLMMVPSQVTAIAWLNLVGPSLYGPGGITLLLGIEHAPLVLLALRAGLGRVPAELLEAGQTAGARPLRLVATIVLPLAAPAFGAGLGLAFVANLGNFAAPALLGIPGRYPVLTTLIYQRLSGFGPRVLGEVADLSLLLGLVAGVALAVEAVIARHRDVLGNGTGTPALPPLGRWRLVAEAGLWLLLAATLAMPLLALLGTALDRAYGAPFSFASLSLENFRYILVEHEASRRALANSFLLALLSALILMLIAIPAAYFAVWRRSPVMRGLLFAASLPYALPGIVLAIAFILLLIRPIFGIGLYGTLGIILLAYLARFLALAERPVSAAFRQLDPHLDEAAALQGAGLVRRLRTIVLPLVLPAAMAGGLLVFLTAFNELTVSALLWSAGHETLGVVLFSLEQAGDIPLAAALAVISTAVTVVLMLLVTRLARALPAGVLPWQG
ncbi:MAG TPA: iron ABC transporter permease [Aliidongia sp.]|nr:iron ABC transporter permease [Aliidongia sp.]